LTSFPPVPTTGDPALDRVLSDAKQSYAISPDGTRLHTVTVGTGPLVILIHGFPDFWFSWRRQMVALAKAGFTACAFDLRGFNLSDAPGDDQAYAEASLVEDVRAVIKASGHTSATVVGHDWGGFVAWRTAFAMPETVQRLVTLNMPHPDLLARSYARNPAQQAAGAYARKFQSLPPGAPLPIEALTQWVTDSAAKAAYIDALSRSNPKGMLAYYRVNYPREPYADPADSDLRTVKVPTLMIYGLKDAYLLPAAIDGAWKLVEAPFQLVTFPAAAHFVQHDEPDAVTNMLVGWLWSC
jgi:pimeloyl-ACP methyl ester carboxylesterase